MYLIFGLSGTTDDGIYLSFLFKQSSNNNIAYIRNFGSAWYSSVSYSNNSYDITFTNKNTYTLLTVLSLKDFSLE